MMKPGRSTLLRKALAGLLSMALLLCCVSGSESFLGPGLSSAAALSAMESISMTDVVAPIEDTVSPTATTDQAHNILAVLQITVPNIKSLEFSVSLSSLAEYTDWWFYDYGETIEPHRLIVDAHPETDRSMDVTLVANGNYAAGTTVMVCGFNSYDAAILALASVSKNVKIGSYLNNTPITDSDESVLSLITLHVGDVNADGTVNVVDSQLALKISAGTMEYTEIQKFAADVNQDGSVNSIDALQIQKYSVGNVNSLWDPNRAMLPTEPIDSLVSGGVYRIKNADTGQYITGGTTASTVYNAGVDINYNSRALYAKFKVTRVSGTPYYSLRCLSEAGGTDKLLYLKLTPDYQLTLSTTNYITYSGHWYIIPTEFGGYELVNRAVPTRILTDFGYEKSSEDCKADYAKSGSIWTFEKPTIQLNYYYDRAYTARESSIQGDSYSVIQGQINEILASVFNANVTTGSVCGIASYGDQCHGTNPSSVTVAQANSNCSHCSNSTCVSYSAGTALTGANAHHKSSKAQVWYLANTIGGHATIQFMMSGHKPCGLDSDTSTHGTDVVAGVSIPSYRVGTAFYTGTSVDYRRKLTALHEISHCLGAVEETSNADSNHGDCVMSYNRRNSALIEAWNKGDYDALYCSSCKQAIVNYLKYY